MKVFISHKREDLEQAEIVAKDFDKLGFKFYLDAYDPYITESPNRACLIQAQINQCTDLCVIITENTKQSWWVPFEIGLSTAADIRIASLIYDGAPKLPSFLRKWPQVKTKYQYNFYLQLLKKSRMQLLHEMKKSQERMNFSYTRDSDIFHRILMEKFRQI